MNAVKWNARQYRRRKHAKYRRELRRRRKERRVCWWTYPIGHEYNYDGHCVSCGTRRPPVAPGGGPF